jgi:hypothetical protein
LVFPDGSRAEIPASWTDLHKICPQKFSLPAFTQHPELIATASSLLLLRNIVDSLLSAKQETQTASRKEKAHAKTITTVADRKRQQTKNLAIPGPTTTRTHTIITGPPDPQNSCYKEDGTDQGGWK